MLTCFWSQWSAFYHIKTYANSTLKSGKKLQQVKGLESKQKQAETGVASTNGRRELH